MRIFGANRRGISSPIALIIVLSLVLLTAATIISLESNFRQAVIKQGNFILEKRAEDFILIDSFPDGSRIRVMNRGPIAVEIVAVYVNHVRTATVTSCEIQRQVRSPCIVPPRESASNTFNLAWIITGTGMTFGDAVTVTSARGNRVQSIFPIGRTGFSSSTNLYAGTGPLSIIFARGSFNFTGNTLAGPVATPADAWGGVPVATRDTMFEILIVNHALGDIMLREESVMYITSITGGGTNTKQFCIADSASTYMNFIPYNRAANPYIIPENPDGDLASGGPPVLVKFAGTRQPSCNSNPNSDVFNDAQVSALFLGMFFYWNGELYSEDIPMATLLLKPGPLARITISPNPGSVPVTKSLQFKATGYDQLNNPIPGLGFSWAVATGTCGTINPASGLFTANTIATTCTNEISASIGSITGYATVTVTPGPITRVEVSPPVVTLQAGGIQQFTASAYDAYGNTVSTSFFWQTTIPGASINSNTGRFTAGGTLGTFNNGVSASASGVLGYANVTVIPGPLDHIVVTPNPGNTTVNGVIGFNAVGYDQFNNPVSGLTFTWATTAPGSSIDQNGLFTAGTVAGSYPNAASASSAGVSGYATVIIRPGLLASINVSPNPGTTVVQGNVVFTAQGYDVYGNQIPGLTFTWSTTAPGSTISPGGLFTAGTIAGTFSGAIQATSGSVTGTASVIINPGAIATITVTPDPGSTEAGGWIQFSAQAYDSFGNPVATSFTWSTSVPGASITNMGFFTAGTLAGSYLAGVSASASGVTEFVDITLTPGPLDHIHVAPSSVSVQVDQTVQFAATGHDQYHNVVSGLTFNWVASDCGTIDAGGLFTAGSAAKTCVDAVSASALGKTGYAMVTVTPGTLFLVTVLPDPAILAVDETVQFSASGYDQYGNPISGLVFTWLATDCGGVDSSGLFTAGTIAKTCIDAVSATANGLTGYADVAVNPGPLASIVITPDPGIVPVNGTLQFNATGYDLYNNTVTGLTFSWNTTVPGALVDAGGLFTAGSVNGTYVDGVSASVGVVVGYADVIVTSGFGGSGSLGSESLANAPIASQISMRQRMEMGKHVS